LGNFLRKHQKVRWFSKNRIKENRGQGGGREDFENSNKEKVTTWKKWGVGKSNCRRRLVVKKPD